MERNTHYDKWRNVLSQHKVRFFVMLTVILLCGGCKVRKTVESGYRPIEKTSDISYNADVAPIIQNNCLTCHSGNSPSAGLALDGYKQLKYAINNKKLLKRINDAKDPMPVGGLMSKHERTTIEKWIKNNFAVDSKSITTAHHNVSSDQFIAPDITPIDIDLKGFEFLEKMQGHWVGKMYLLGRNLPWFAFDFRAINTSQVHGLFEGGSMGNLFNTFFVAQYKGVKTIMLRNGGILNGIYRTSYFVMIEAKANQYLFVDAYGGKQIMWVQISFGQDKMRMLVHTSKLGEKSIKRHMEFNGERLHADLAHSAAKRFNFPTKQVVKSFPEGMPIPNWGDQYPVVTSASYIMAQNGNTDYETLGKWAQDPIQLKDIDHIATLTLKFKRTEGACVSITATFNGWFWKHENGLWVYRPSCHGSGFALPGNRCQGKGI